MIEIKCKGADTLPLDAIEDFQGGLKKRTKDDIGKIIKSIETYGFSFPFFVWNGSGHNYCIDGHGRIQALAELRKRGEDLPLFPVVYIDAEDEEEAKNKLLRLNSQYGDMTVDTVMEFAGDISVKWEELKLPSGNLTFASDQDESIDAEAQIDRGEELKAEWGVEYGQLWQLGDHRILCGDSTNSDDVDRLLMGDKPVLMVTDPPYGVEYNASWRADAGVNKNQNKMGKIESDDRNDWSDAYKLFTGNVVYIWHAARYTSEVAESIEESGFGIRAQIIWVKDRFALSRGHYHWHHEPCWYGVRDKAYWIGDRKQSTVWKINARDDSGLGHSTQKPIEAMARPIRNHDSEFVYEPFSGSGTTIIACEQLGRKCRAIEILPEYVAITLQRYLDATGKKPVIIDNQ